MFRSQNKVLPTYLRPVEHLASAELSPWQMYCDIVTFNVIWYDYKYGHLDLRFSLSIAAFMHWSFGLSTTTSWLFFTTTLLE